jgi:exonuclease III
MKPEQLRCTTVTYQLGQDIDEEGRSIIVEIPWATIVNLDVPNSGQKLERVDFRTKEWDQLCKPKKLNEAYQVYGWVM